MVKYYLFQLLRFVDRMIPRRAAYALGALLAELFYLFSPRSRANFRANLLHVLRYSGEETGGREARRNVRRLVRKNFRNFAYYLVDFFRFSRFRDHHLRELVEVEGKENVDLCLERGKGAIGVTAHLGNWELGGIIFSLLGYSINAIALSHENTKLNRLFVHQRALGGVNVIPVGRAALRSLRALKKNEIVVILGDRAVTEAGMEVDFFGAPAQIPRGPASLAVRSGAEIFFGYFIRESTHKYRTVFGPPIEFDRSKSREEQIKEVIRALVKEMEGCILKNLSQWYMYYRIWPEDDF